MSQILETYKDLFDNNHRFIDEIFDAEIYQSAVPKLTIIDLGAYEGEFPLYCYNFAKDIYAFEPDPVPYANLKRRIETFKLDKIKFYQMAIGGNMGERLFHASGFGGSRLLGEGDTEYPRPEVIKVPVISLAQFINENKIEHVDILKVDIEGGEDEVFEAEDFKNVVGRIDTIIGEHLAPVHDLLLKYGYEPEVVEGSNTIYRK